jgi:hypothetical protein
VDPVTNPYSPGAGAPPPALTGRDELIERVRVVTERVRRRNSTKSVLMVGLRGVGKTVLLDTTRTNAENAGIHTLRIEAPEDRSLPAMLAPELRRSLIRLSHVEKAKDLAERALRGLAGFAKVFKLQYSDIEVGLDLEALPGLADNGDLQTDLQALLTAAGEAALKADTALAIFVDELQYVAEDQLAALITALHGAAQQRLPVVLIGAGLPQLRAATGQAKSYAERLFEFPEVGPLDELAARQAISRPAQTAGVDYTDAALDRIMEKTRGYPYFIQEWGKHCWDVATTSPITLEDVDKASRATVAALDASFFRVRFDRLSPGEKRYLRAMAELGFGPHRSGDISQALNRQVTALGPTRSSLIKKGMIWSPNYGDTAFTVPLFDEFMRRMIPEFE